MIGTGCADEKENLNLKTSFLHSQDLCPQHASAQPCPVLDSSEVKYVMIVKRMLSSADMLIAILLAVRRDLCFNTTTIMTQKELDKQSVRVVNYIYRGPCQ